MHLMKTDYERAVEVIRSRIHLQPTIGLVLGSGLGGLADTLEDATVIPYDEIPNWPRSTVPGHSGKLVIGRLEGKIVAAQQGRAHFYEGYSLEQVTFPIRVMHYLGVQTVILTNAAGGLNTNYQVGDLMLLNDHINMMGLSGFNVLVGPNDETLGERFVPQGRNYHKELRQLAKKVAAEAGITIHEGVYVCLSGPTFETPAEVRFLRMVGGDAVGMSTVHEVIVARHAGMRVLAFSGITNVANDTVDAPLDANHEEVMEAGKILVPRLTTVLKGVLRAMP
jgi:purine-nucleoside phosphorylase